MRFAAAIWLLAFQASAAAAPPSLWVRLPIDSASCRIDSLIAAIRLRRPGIEVRLGTPTVAGDVAVTLSSAEGIWELIVTGGDHEPLRRELPPPMTDCTATADTAALMIDRYLADLHWAGPEAPFMPAPPPAEPLPLLTRATRASVAPPVLPAREPSVSASAGPVSAQSSQRRPRYQLVVELAPAIGASPVGALPLLQLDVGVRRDWLQLGLGGSAALPQQQVISSSTPSLGSYSIQLGSIELSAAARLQWGPGTVRFELLPGTELLWVSASRGTGPKLFQFKPGFGPSPFAGARVGYEFPLPAGFAVALRAEGRVMFQQAEFAVEGYAGGIVTPPVDGNVSLALSRIFF